MSHHARIEEVSDSDPDDMDPADFDPTQSLLAPANIPSTSRASSSSSSSPTPPSAATPGLPGRVSTDPARDRERSKNWQCLYPVYFDSGRSRAEGRRVGREQGVPNPLAREILDAVGSLGIRDIVFEPMKIHPKDWANPGRVRVLIKEGGRATGGRVKNKHHLYILVSAYLKAHPTTEQSPMRLRIAGLPAPTKPMPPPAVPRGWRLNSILPLHSAAVSGGGVSENFLKEMMAEMQGQAGGAGAVESGGEGKKKKDKKKGKA